MHVAVKTNLKNAQSTTVCTVGAMLNTKLKKGNTPARHI